MAKKPTKHEDEPDDDDKPGKSEDAPGHNKPEPKNLVEAHEPYPTGSPPDADAEKRRAAGLPPDAKI